MLYREFPIDGSDNREVAMRERLRAARKRKHWTLERAAQEIGVGINTLNRWELGQAEPYAQNVARLCEVYGATAAELGLQSSDESPVVSDTTIFTDLTMQLMAIAFLPGSSYQNAQNAITGILEEHRMNNSDITRREAFDALRRLAGLPLISLHLSAMQPAVLNQPAQDILTQCSAAIAACWELSKSDDDEDMSLAFQRVSDYLPTLKVIVRDNAMNRKAAASLAGQCELLRTMLAWHLYGLKQAAQYAQEAVKYCTQAGDRAMLLSVLDYQAWVYSYDNRPKQALSAIQQALPIMTERGAPVSPQLLAGVYSTLALMTAKNGRDGKNYLRKAADSFFTPADADDRFVYMDYTRGDLVLNDGMTHYEQRDYRKALDSLGQLIDTETLRAKIALPERSRIEALNTIALAQLKTKDRDMESILHVWDTAIAGAKHLQSEQRFSEARTGYDIMEALWPDEKRIEERRELALHW